MKKHFFLLGLFLAVAAITFSQNTVEELYASELVTDEDTHKYPLPDSDSIDNPEAPARGGCTMTVENTTTLSMYLYLNGIYYTRIRPGATYTVTPSRSRGNFYARSATSRVYFEGSYNACEKNLRLLNR